MNDFRVYNEMRGMGVSEIIFAAEWREWSALVAWSRQGRGTVLVRREGRRRRPGQAMQGRGTADGEARMPAIEGPENGFPRVT